jgi:hypothetical protein
MAGIGLKKKSLLPAMTMCTPYIFYAKQDLSYSLKSDVASVGFAVLCAAATYESRTHVRASETLA